MTLLKKGAATLGAGLALWSLSTALDEVGVPLLSTFLFLAGLAVLVVSWRAGYKGWCELCRADAEKAFCRAYTVSLWAFPTALLLIFPGLVAIELTLEGTLHLKSLHLLLAVLAVGAGLLVTLACVVVVVRACFRLAKVYGTPNVGWWALTLALAEPLAVGRGKLGLAARLAGLALVLASS